MNETATIENTDDTNYSQGRAAGEPSDNDDYSQDDGQPDELVQDETTADGQPEGGQEENDDDVIELPQNFKNEDGTVNLKALSKAFKDTKANATQLSQKIAEFEKQAQQFDDFKKQQDEIARLYGFQSVEDLNNHKTQIQYNAQMAQIEANEYAQYLRESDYPDEVRKLLIQYSQNPSKELLESIEAEFGVETIKKVAQGVATKKGQYEAQLQQARFQQFEADTRAYLQGITTKYADEFKSPEFVDLYGEAFKVLGANLDSDLFISKLNALKGSWIKEYEAGKNADKQNADAIGNIEAISPNSVSKKTGRNNLDLKTASEDEIKQAVSNYFK